MCTECGCNIFGMAYMEPVDVVDVSRDGEAGLTLDMSSTPEQTRQFINE
jgi:hypothetical protein